MKKGNVFTKPANFWNHPRNLHSLEVYPYTASVYPYFWNHLSNLHSTEHANSKPPCH